MPVPLNGGRVRFYFRAQNAIWHALRILNLPPDANILFPAYHCGSELDPLIKAGVDIRFYPVNERMRIDFESARRSLNARTRAFYLTHYLGFPLDLEEAAEFCARFGLTLIEDCAPALYSSFRGRPLGTFGNVGIFSMRKSLPIPDGGALIVNDHRLPMPESACAPPMTYTLRAARDQFDHLLVQHGGRVGRWVKHGLLDPCASLAKRVGGRVSPESWVHAGEYPDAFNANRRDWGLSPVARMLIRRTKHEEVVRRRRENFQFLLDRLRTTTRLGLLISELPGGVCPWYFPVLAPDPADLINHLRPLGKDVLRLWGYFHPRFPRNGFPEAARLKTHVVALPIDQDQDVLAMGALADRVTSFP
jgi:dTDP-4-amino-4,6-dideoxygalactose transaminase